MSRVVLVLIAAALLVLGAIASAFLFFVNVLMGHGGRGLLWLLAAGTAMLAAVFIVVASRSGADESED